MKVGSFGYLVKEGTHNVWANRVMSLASVGVLVACMLLIGASVLLSVNLNQVVGYMENQNEMVVYLAEDVSEQDAADTEQKLKMMGNVQAVTFVSKDEGLQQMMDYLGDEDLYLGLQGEENPLLDSFVVKVNDLSQLDDTVSRIQQLDSIDSVAAPSDLADTVTQIKRIIYWAGLAIIAILVTVSLVIIANTIKVTVFNRRKEINIMKYVGATDVFIKFPFVVEGCILGLVSALLSYGLLWGGYTYLSSWMSENSSQWIQFLGGDIVPFSSISMTLLLGFLVGGMGIGIFGSLLFTRKYLRV